MTTIQNTLAGLTLLALFALLPTAYAVQNTNVSILYGWNGTNFIPLLTDSTGRLQTDINITDSVGINPRTNGSFSLGTTQREWQNIYAVSAAFSKNISIGGWASRQTLDVNNGNVAIDQNKLLILNGSTSTEYISFDAANLRMRFNVRDVSGYGFAFTNNSGTPLMFINNSKVGIGTSTPTVPLEVTGTADNQQLRLSDGEASLGRLELGYDATSDYGRIQAWKVGVLAVNLSLQPAGGTVGIGTTTPETTLHLNSSTTELPKLTIENSNADNAPPHIILKKLSASAANLDQLAEIDFHGKDSGGANTEFARIIARSGLIDDGSEQGEIHFRALAAGSEALVMAINGSNVGIGTAGPQTKLHVAGGEVAVDAGQAITFNGTGSSTDTSRQPYIYFSGSGRELLFRNGVNDGDMSFGVNSGAASIIINSTGNVGINTASPGQKLDVVGNISLSHNGNASIIRNPQASPWAPLDIIFSNAASGGSPGIRLRTGGADNNVQTARERITIGSDADLVAISMLNGYVGVGVAASSTYSLFVNASTGAGFKVGDTTSGTGVEITTVSGKNRIISYNRTSNSYEPLYFGTTSGENTLYLGNNGNVGIGTTSPGRPLHIMAASDAENLELQGRAADGISTIKFSNNARTQFANWQYQADSNLFQFYQSQGTATSFAIMNANVGINTTSPNTKLHIRQSANNATGGLRLSGEVGGNCWLYTTGSANCGSDTQVAAGASYRICAGCD